MKGFVATFLVLIFAANQSFAAICAEACQLAATKAKTQVVDSSESSHDCHGKRSRSEEPEKAPSDQNCDTSFCVGTVYQPQPLIDQVQEKDGIKKILIRGEIVSPELPLYVQNDFFVRFRTPLPQKIRLHLLLQRLLI